jgi:hypothetical protein
MACRGVPLPLQDGLAAVVRSEASVGSGLRSKGSLESTPLICAGRHDGADLSGRFEGVEHGSAKLAYVRRQNQRCDAIASHEPDGTRESRDLQGRSSNGVNLCRDAE